MILKLLYCPVPNIETGRMLAKGLLEKKLCACVNILPQVTSLYPWEGKIVEEVEAVLLIKTTEERAKAVSDWLEKHHPYEIPAILTISLDDAHQPFVNWVKSEISKKGSS